MPRRTYLHNLSHPTDPLWIALADVPNASCKVIYDRNTGEISLEEIQGKMRPWWKTAIKRTFKHMLRTIQAGGEWDNKGADKLYHKGRLGAQHDLSAPIGYEQHEIARLVDQPTADTFDTEEKE